MASIQGPQTGHQRLSILWRDTGCESHFIIWRNGILLFGQGDDDFWLRGRADEIAAISGPVHERLPVTGLVSYVDIADALGEVPWDALNACRRLVRNGIAREGVGKQRGTFGRV